MKIKHVYSKTRNKTCSEYCTDIKEVLLQLLVSIKKPHNINYTMPYYKSRNCLVDLFPW